MRLLFCTDTFPPQVNGVSVVTALTVRGLQARGWDCAVVAPAYPAEEGPQVVDVRDVPVTTVPSVRWPPYPEIRLALPARAVVRRAVETFRPALVHCATEFVIGRLGKAEAQRLGVPFCSSYHTDFAKYTAAYGVPWLRRPVTRWIGRFHADAARTFTPSVVARDDLFRLGLRHVEVWGRGVDDATFHPGRRSLAVRQRLDVGHAFTFLHVGRLAPEKNVELLLKAFALLRETAPHANVRLVVAGSGPSLPGLRAMAGEGVTFLGTLDRERELPGLYASCDAFAYASETETLGLVVLEAMASGLPVVAVPAGGVADHLRDGVNGLAYPAGSVRACAESMRRLVEDHGLREELRGGARATAARLSWGAELDRLDATYREVLARRSVAA